MSGYDAKFHENALDKLPAVRSDGTWDPKIYEEAMDLVAKRLASFRLGLDADDPYAFNENEKLMAGIIVGSLWANNLLTDRINAATLALSSKDAP